MTRDADPQVAPVGWNLADEPAPLEVAPGPGDMAVAWRDDLAGTADVSLVDLPVVAEAEGDPDPIELPAVISGRIGSAGEIDAVPVRAPAGRSIVVRVAARSLGSPLDPVLRVVDASGEQLAEEDDARQSRDPEATVKVPADGVLRLLVRDLHGRGGPGFIYRIEAREPSPDFALTVDSDHVELTPGTPLEVAVSVDRRDGFDRPIAIEAEGLPEGVTIEAVASERRGDPGRRGDSGRRRGDSARGLTVRLTAAEAVPWSGPIRLIGRPEGEGAPRSATAERIGGSRTDSIWLTVRPAE